MPETDGDEAFVETVRAVITDQMTAAGWSVDPAIDCGWPYRYLAAFRRSTVPDFAAVVRFDRRGIINMEQLGSIDVGATVAVDYEPLYCLMPLILEQASDGELAVEIEETATPPLDDLTVTVTTPAHAPSVAPLVDAVVRHALPYATSRSTFEALLTATRGEPDDDGDTTLAVPILLASAHRYDEAREALDGSHRLDGQAPTELAYRRSARQLRIWLDESRVIPDPPTAVVGRPRRRRGPRPSLSETRARRETRHQAADAARERSAGTSLDETRTIVREEYVRLGVPTSNLSVEIAAVDIMRRQTRLGGAAANVQGLTTAAGALVRMTSGLVKMFRDDDPPPKRKTPDWLEPPEEALYPVRRQRDAWVDVELDGSALPHLERAYQEVGSMLQPVLGIPPSINVAHLTAWLSRAAEDGQLLVSLGARAVGAVPAADAHRYDEVMTAAAARRELPRLDAALAVFDDPRRVILEIIVPR